MAASPICLSDDLPPILSGGSHARESAFPDLRSRLPVLVTGITGVAGYSAFLDLQRRYPGQVIGIRPVNNWRLAGPGIVALNIENAVGLAELFHRHRFKSVLNALGNCALKSCELDREMAWQMNVGSVESLSACVDRHGSRLVHLSSDLVFSGTGDGGHLESDAVDPVTVYGGTMALGEEKVLLGLPEAVVLRISLPMGPSFNRHAGAIDWIDSRFRAGRPATLYFDEVRSCAYVQDLNRVYAWMLAGNACGLFHCGGPQPITLYQIGQVVNRAGGYDPDLLRGCERAAAGPMPPRAGNVSMDSSKLAAWMGCQPLSRWPHDEALQPGGAPWHRQRRAGEPAGREAIRSLLYGYRTKEAIEAVECPQVGSPGLEDLPLSPQA